MAETSSHAPVSPVPASRAPVSEASDSQASVVHELPTARERPFDPPDALGRLRSTKPISRLAYPDGHLGWLVTSHGLARSVLADPRFSRRRELQRIPRRFPLVNEARQPSEPGFFIGMDPPDHTRYRRLLTGQFTVRRMRELEPRITQITDEHLDAMERHGPPVDLVPAFALPIPSLVICELLGVPYSDRERFQTRHQDPAQAGRHGRGSDRCVRLAAGVPARTGRTQEGRARRRPAERTHRRR